MRSKPRRRRRSADGPRSSPATTRSWPRRPARARRSRRSSRRSTRSCTAPTRGALGEGIDVVYVSPLKALSSDVQKNLEAPLAGIRDAARELGLTPPDIRTALRTGDTTPAARAAIVKNAPHVLITTPESLYLMLTAEKSRELLRRVRTVVVDEVHALMRDKRGSHLALSLARLDALAERRPAAHRPLGDGAPHPRRGAVPLRAGPPVLDRRRRPPARPRSGHRAAGDRPPGGRDERAVERDLRPPRGARRRAPDDARLREHAPHGRARGASSRRAARRGSGRRPPREPREGPPAADRAAPQGGGDARARRDRVARAGDRRRDGGPRLPDRLAARGDDVPPAHRPVGPRPRAHVARAPLRDVARRAGGVRGARAGRRRRGSSTGSNRRWRRSTSSRSRSWPSAPPASGPRTRSSRSCGPRRRSRASSARRSTRSSAASPRGRRRGRVARARSSTAIG